MLTHKRALCTALNTSAMLIGIHVISNDRIECVGESIASSLRSSLSPPQHSRHLPSKQVSQNPRFRLTRIHPHARPQWQTQKVVLAKTFQYMAQLESCRASFNSPIMEHESNACQVKWWVWRRWPSFISPGYRPWPLCLSLMTILSISPTMHAGAAPQALVIAP
jgi:hypothetical protein